MSSAQTITSAAGQTATDDLGIERPTVAAPPASADATTLGRAVPDSARSFDPAVMLDAATLGQMSSASNASRSAGRRSWWQRLITPSRDGRLRVLAIASGGGHWIQLSRVMRGFHHLDDVELTYVTTLPGYRSHVDGRRFYVIKDGNRHKKVACVISAAQLFWVLVNERPNVVITTGAACGYLCVRLARFLGARTVWIDSIANAHELSGSGQLVGPYADLWLTQWPDLARPEGPHFMGSVL